MKKKILFILALAAVLLSACKMKLSENTGTVIIDFGSNERAVDTNGLPFIKDAYMSLEINSPSQSTKKIEFAAGQEKTWSGSFPVGERIGIKVTISTASAEWKGSTGHTVKEGANKVEIKLKKSVAALKGLLFGIYKQLDPSGAAGYDTLTLKIGSKEITKTNVVSHSFCRDNKGRTYLAYKTGNQWDMERYTSEGDKESKTFNLPERCYGLILASDHATGAVYLAAEIGGSMKLLRINEDGTTKELALQGGAQLSYINGYAVYDNGLITLALGHGAAGQELKIYHIDGDQLSETTLSPSPDLNEDTKITLGVSAGPVHSTINDLYMTKDALYLLFSAFGNHSSDSYSLGGIVKYSYSADGTTASISNPVRIGIANDHTSDGNGIYPTEESDFYGPVKVIGFDEENLYIADDGVQFEYQKGKPRLTANKNRIAALKKEDDTLTFTDAPSGITWMGENPVWPGVNTKTIVWTKNSVIHNPFSGGVSYYQLTQPDGTPSPDNLLQLDSSGTSPNQTLYFTDVFCFDEAGNLYIVRHEAGNYCICRFELQDDGSYDQEPSIMTNNLSDSPTAIDVDISGSVETADGQSVNALYYSYDYGNKSCIKRLIWGKNAEFFSAAADTSFGAGGDFAGPQDTTSNPQTKTRFTALAADKNGFFVGETFKNTTTKKYTINVKKYAHTAAGYNRPESTIEVVPETVYYSGTVGSIEFSLSENLNALYIQDGILFGVTAKEFRNNYDSHGFPKKASISGKLWQIGKTDAAFPAGTLKHYYSSEPDPWPGNDEQRKEGGKFAPYRFIAVKPKNMIIASDGFYGCVEGGQNKAAQYNRVVQFVLNENGSLTGGNSASDAGGAGSGITFSKELEADSNFTWE